MKVAVYLSENVPYSMRFCAENIMAICKKKYPIQFIPFSSLQNIPTTDIDVYWIRAVVVALHLQLFLEKRTNP